MGGVSGSALAVAVAQNGGLGMVSGEGRAADTLDRLLSQVRRTTSAPFGVNFIVQFLEDLASVDVAATYASIVEFFYGEPNGEFIQRVHQRGAVASWQVGSAAEARAAERAGCDVVVVQGVEAGGHLRGRLPLAALLAEVLAAVRVPVLAAGGIGTGRAVAAALSAGAAGVRVGTRFVAAQESDAHPFYVEALCRAGAEDTMVTNAFSRSWPNAPHRVLRSCVEAVGRTTSDIVAEYIDNGVRKTVKRFAGTEPTAAMSGTIEAMALYAGESVTAVRERQPAASILRELSEELGTIRRRTSSRRP